jgi:tRNA(Glu) U13 pseudouridine synthase TruD
MKGSYRAILAPFRDFKHSRKEDCVDVSFSIPAGSYATILLNELMKNNSLDLNMIAPELGSNKV